MAGGQDLTTEPDAPASTRAGTEPAEPGAARRALLDAALALFNERFLDRITLDDLAARAGTDVDTAIAVFGSKENIFPEIAKDLAGRMPSVRFTAAPGDPREAISRLLDDYETWGDVLLRALMQEERFPALRPFLELGRTVHRDWVGAMFEDAMSSLDSAQRRLRIAELAAVTDVYVWGKLRRHSELSAAETRAAMIHLVEALLQSYR